MNILASSVRRNRYNSLAESGLEGCIYQGPGKKMVNDFTEFYKVINSTDYINTYNTRTTRKFHMEYTQCLACSLFNIASKFSVCKFQLLMLLYK